MNEKILEELKQFLAYARREGVVNSETADKLENFAIRYIKNII